MSLPTNEGQSQVAFQNDSQTGLLKENNEKNLHSSIPGLDEFISAVRESKTEVPFDSEFDREGTHDKTYDRGTEPTVFDRTH